MSEKPEKKSQRTVLAVIMGGLLAWALYIAIGAYLYNFRIVPAIIVVGCMAMFVGVWLLLLRTTGRDKQR